MILRTYILDDEPDAVKLIAFYIKKYCPGIKIVGSSSYPPEAIEFLRENDFDLLLTDIEMPYYNGFEVIKELKNKKFQVIFTTAHEKYALQAIRCAALDYLLKPIEHRQLIAALHHARLKGEVNNFPLKQMNNLLINQVTKKQLKKIALPVKDGALFVSIDQIVVFASQGTYTEVFTKEGQFLASKPLKEYEELMPDEDFVRVHQSYLININCIKKFVNKDGGFLEMDNGMEIEISRRKKSMLMNRLTGKG